MTNFRCCRYMMRYLEFTRETLPDEMSNSRLRAAEGITSVDYMKPFFDSTLQESTSNLASIRSVEFYGAMLMDNFLLILNHCTSMCDLTFTYVSLDDYRRWSPARYGLDASSTPFVASSLTSLEFNGAGDLSKSELLLLDMLLNWVDLPELETLSFNNMNYGYRTSEFPNIVMDEFGETVPESTLNSLLVKCHGTLDSFQVRRNNFTLAPPQLCTSSDSDPESPLQAIKLRKLRCQYDTSGLPELLRSQHNLEKIECYGSHTDSNLLNKEQLTQLYGALGQAVFNSSETLKQLHFVSLTAVPPAEEVDSEEEIEANQVSVNDSPVVLDFEKFQNCTNLTGIWLSKMTHSRADGMDIFSATFTFINAHCLPTSLIQLEVFTGFVKPEELLRLTRRLPDLINLHYCRIHSFQEFNISKECFSNIVSMQHSWMQVLLFNGVFAPDFYPQQVLMEHNPAQNRRHWEVRVSNGICEFLCKEARQVF